MAQRLEKKKKLKLEKKVVVIKKGIIQELLAK